MFLSRIQGCSIIALALIFISGAYAGNDAMCVSPGDPCVDDCDCCNYDDRSDDKGVRCEDRYTGVYEAKMAKFGEYSGPLPGRRCYQCTFTGHICTKNSDCCSQHCVKDAESTEFGVCMKNHPPPQPCYTDLMAAYSSITAVSGITIEEDGLCPCTDLDANMIAVNLAAATDKRTNTDYLNNYGVGSGVIVATNVHAPVRKVVVCSNNDCPECDPLCYKLEGKCENIYSQSDWTFIQEGALDMPLERGACVSVNIVGRHQYSEYRLTFPCMRGGFGYCETEQLTEEMKTIYPIGDSCPEGESFDFGLLQWNSEPLYNEIEDITTFYYRYRNKVKETDCDYDCFNDDKVAMKKLMILWEGNCKFLGYEVKIQNRVRKGRRFKIVYETIKNGTVPMHLDSPDPDLCMHGASFDTTKEDGTTLFDTYGSDAIDYYIYVYLHGYVSYKEMGTGKYGINNVDLGGDGKPRRDYNQIQAPDCTTTAPSCTNYPMKISELSLGAKCDEMGDVAAKQWDGNLVATVG